jgi:hypothetical protein
MMVCLLFHYSTTPLLQHSSIPCLEPFLIPKASRRSLEIRPTLPADQEASLCFAKSEASYRASG